MIEDLLGTTTRWEMIDAPAITIKEALVTMLTPTITTTRATEMRAVNNNIQEVLHIITTRVAMAVILTHIREEITIFPALIIIVAEITSVEVMVVTVSHMVVHTVVEATAGEVTLIIGATSQDLMIDVAEKKDLATIGITAIIHHQETISINLTSLT